MFLNENTTFQFDYWKNGFEGNNSLGGWLLFKEIEYLIFPNIVDFEHNGKQDLKKIKALLAEIGQFVLENNDKEIKLYCYRK